MANREFAKLVPNFVLVKVSTKNGRSPEAKALKLQRNTGYVLVFSADGTEIARLVNPRTLEPIVETLEKTAKQTLDQRRNHTKQLLEYVSTLRTVTPTVRKKVAEDVEALGSDEFEVREQASERLEALGATGYKILVETKSDSPEGRKRIRSILTKYEMLQEAVEILRLDRDVTTLARLADGNAHARGRLRTILPKTAPKANVADWWATHAKKYSWNEERDRYEPINP